jgi:hypothetical protein
MLQESRKWFDSAYKFTEGILPFGYVTGEFQEDNLKRLARNQLDSNELIKLGEWIRSFHKNLPPKEDFKEEKEAVLSYLVPDLKKKLYFVDAAILFGRIVGDIDIGLIDYDCHDKEFSEAVYLGCEIVKKYPIVDWDALYFFKSKNGKELASKILSSRLLPNQTRLDNGELEYVKQTVYTARLLWGNENELASMKNYIEGFD